MSSLIAQISDAIVTELNAQTFSQEFTAVRKWLAKWTLPELATLRVSVVPGPATYTMASRGQDDERHEIDIAVQKKIDAGSIAAVDILVELMEEFIAHFRAKLLMAGTTNIICVVRALVPGAEAAVAREHLEDLRTFTGVIRTTWLVRQR